MGIINVHIINQCNASNFEMDTTLYTCGLRVSELEHKSTMCLGYAEQKVRVFLLQMIDYQSFSPGPAATRVLKI